MDLPHQVPVMTLPNAILYPQAMLPLYIFEPRYRDMLSDSLDSHRMFTVAMQKPDRLREAPCRIAGLGLIRASVVNADGTSNLILQGMARVELTRTVRTKPYRVHQIRVLESSTEDPAAVDVLAGNLVELVGRRLEQGFKLPSQAVKIQVPSPPDKKAPELMDTLKKGIEYLTNIKDPDQLADMISCTLLTNAADRQEILETVSVENRLQKLIEFLFKEVERNQNDETP